MWVPSILTLKKDAKAKNGRWMISFFIVETKNAPISPIIRGGAFW